DPLGLEGGERGVLQLPEGPLVRIGDERNRFRCENAVRRSGVRRYGRVDLVVWDEQPIGHQRVVQAAREEQVVLLREDEVHLAVQRSVPLEDEAARVPERAPERVGHSGWSVWGGAAPRRFRPVRKPTMRFQKTFTATPAPRMAATIPCQTRLADEGSI